MKIKGTIKLIFLKDLSKRWEGCVMVTQLIKKKSKN